MTTGAIVLLGCQAAVFAVWGFLAFRTLFGLARRARALTGKVFPGPGSFVAVTRGWMADPACRTERGALALTSAVLLSLSILMAVLRPF